MPGKTKGTKKSKDNTLDESLEDLTREQVELALRPKDARIEIRVTSDEKREIEELANRFGITTTQYLTKLHRLARTLIAGHKSRNEPGSSK